MADETAADVDPVTDSDPARNCSAVKCRAAICGAEPVEAAPPAPPRDEVGSGGAVGAGEGSDRRPDAVPDAWPTDGLAGDLASASVGAAGTGAGVGAGAGSGVGVEEASPRVAPPPLPPRQSRSSGGRPRPPPSNPLGEDVGEGESPLLVVGCNPREVLIQYDRRVKKASLRQDPEAAGDLARLLVNRSVVLQRLRRWDLSLSDCTRALKINPTYTKALAQAALGFIGVKQYLRGKQLLSAVLDKARAAGDGPLAAAVSAKLASLDSPVMDVVREFEASRAAEGADPTTATLQLWQSLAKQFEDPHGDLSQVLALLPLVPAIVDLQVVLLYFCGVIVQRGGSFSNVGFAKEILFKMMDDVLPRADEDTADDVAAGRHSEVAVARGRVTQSESRLETLCGDPRLTSLSGNLRWTSARGFWLHSLLTIPTREELLVVEPQRARAFVVEVSGVVHPPQLELLLVSALCGDATGSRVPTDDQVAVLQGDVGEREAQKWQPVWSLMQYTALNDAGVVDRSCPTFEREVDQLTEQECFDDIQSVDGRRVVVLDATAPTEAWTVYRVCERLRASVTIKKELSDDEFLCCMAMLSTASAAEMELRRTEADAAAGDGAGAGHAGVGTDGRKAGEESPPGLTSISEAPETPGTAPEGPSGPGVTRDADSESVGMSAGSGLEPAAAVAAQ